MFVNGPASCDVAPGLEDVLVGPARCWYNTPTTAKVAAAHEAIQEIIERQGPFDGVMGFSQVCKTATRAASSRSNNVHSRELLWQVP